MDSIRKIFTNICWDSRNQFSSEYFTFMRKLIQCNAPFVTVTQGEKLSKGESESSADRTGGLIILSQMAKSSA